jgi:hypothetical protein
MDQTPSLLFGAEPHRPGHETINPAPDDAYRAPVGGNLRPALSTTSTDPVRLTLLGVGPTLTIMALTARACEHIA